MKKTKTKQKIKTKKLVVHDCRSCKIRLGKLPGMTKICEMCGSTEVVERPFV